MGPTDPEVKAGIAISAFSFIRITTFFARKITGFMYSFHIPCKKYKIIDMVQTRYTIL